MNVLSPKEVDMVLGHLRSGLSMREVAHITGHNKTTVAHYARIHGPFSCGCGKPQHNGWCAWRVARSPARQAVLSEQLHKSPTPSVAKPAKCEKAPSTVMPAADEKFDPRDPLLFGIRDWPLSKDGENIYAEVDWQELLKFRRSELKKLDAIHEWLDRRLLHCVLEVEVLERLVRGLRLIDQDGVDCVAVKTGSAIEQGKLVTTVIDDVQEVLGLSADAAPTPTPVQSSPKEPAESKPTKRGRLAHPKGEPSLPKEPEAATIKVSDVPHPSRREAVATFPELLGAKSAARTPIDVPKIPVAVVAGPEASIAERAIVALGQRNHPMDSKSIGLAIGCTDVALLEKKLHVQANLGRINRVGEHIWEIPLGTTQPVPDSDHAIEEFRDGHRCMRCKEFHKLIFEFTEKCRRAA
jgi:hypothetical protein